MMEDEEGGGLIRNMRGMMSDGKDICRMMAEDTCMIMVGMVDSGGRNGWSNRNGSQIEMVGRRIRPSVLKSKWLVDGIRRCVLKSKWLVAVRFEVSCHGGVMHAARGIAGHDR